MGLIGPFDFDTYRCPVITNSLFVRGRFALAKMVVRSNANYYILIFVIAESTYPYLPG